MAVLTMSVESCVLLARKKMINWMQTSTTSSVVRQSYHATDLRYTRNCGTNPSPHSTLLQVVPCSDLEVLEKALEVSSGSRVWWKFAARSPIGINLITRWTVLYVYFLVVPVNPVAL